MRVSRATADSRTNTPRGSPEVGPRNDSWAVQAGESAFVASQSLLAQLDQAVGALNPYLGDTVIPAGLVINPLLDIWDAAQSIDPSVSSAVKQFLTVLVERTSVTPAELTSTVDEMRIAALQASVLADALANV